MFEGVFPAIITPFTRGNRPVTDDRSDLDLEGLRVNVKWLVDQGVHGIVPCGSTGESATMSHKEHEKVIEETVDVVNGRVPVLAGTGSNNTEEAVLLTKAAKNLGADGVLVISPYYNKPNRSGLIKHYTKLANLDIPVVMYNVPGRTGQDINVFQPPLVPELAKHPNIVGIKEASGKLDKISEIIEATRDQNFSVISGDDNLTLPILELGGVGVISVAANVEPKLMVEMYEAFKKGDLARAREVNNKLGPLFKDLFIDTNPIPVKKAVGLRGMAAGPVRLPLDDLDAEKTEILKKTLALYGR
ncbi:MAG TPA: 4-hydroxy-tetrahydrodipicolinate synthase [Methanomicrobiales archaeon]|jgi:4-hydroxy-tetrahydrodipicolinate synthase|nr:4-hydroxy-tetrahydrodipicolinate synthase [Methanomicrobiales archaeon]